MTVAARQLAARAAQHRALGLSRRRRVPRARWPSLIESDYAGRLVGIVRRLRAVVERDLPSIVAELRVDDESTARARRSAARVRREAEATIDEHGIEATARDVAKRAADHQRAELTRQTTAAIGVQPFFLDPKIADLVSGFVHENATLIKALRGRALDEFENIITRAYASGSRAEDVGEEIAARFDIAERHARLIARDQIGKLNARVTEARHRELGLSSFEWVSMRDSRVRPRHVSLDGRRFRYDKLPAEGLPGTPVCCRCVQQPVFDDLLALVEAL